MRIHLSVWWVCAACLHTANQSCALACPCLHKPVLQGLPCCDTCQQLYPPTWVQLCHTL